MSVTSIRHKLTPEDIHRLAQGGTPEERAIATHKLCRHIDIPLSEEQRQSANAILGILARDMAALVRRTLAVTLRNSPYLPRETALQLARDIEGVATPILKNSPSLSDKDLIELLEAGSPEKQLAIAERANISTPVTEAVAQYGDARANMAMASNESADISEQAYNLTLSRFANNSEIHHAIIARERIPVTIAEKLVNMVTGELFDTLVNNHSLSPQLAIKIAESSRERAVLDLIEQAGCATDPGQFAQYLNTQGRLGASFIMRAMCLGHIRFVEHALAELSGLPHQKVWLLLHDAGELGLKTLFGCTGLPVRMLRAFELAVEAFHQTELDDSANGRMRFRRLMIERVLTRFQAVPPSDLHYLLEKLDALDEIKAAPAAAVS